MSIGKSSSNSKSNTQSTQTAAQTGTQAQTSSATPNNLPFLQQGWGALSSLFGGLNPSDQSSALANGVTLGASTGTNVAGAATGALGTAGALSTNPTGNSANGYLTPIANGSQIGNNNPDFQNVVNQIANSARAATDGNFAADGRYGSGANANAFNSAVTNEAGQLGYSNYNQSLQNQLAATGQLSTNSTNQNNAALAALGLIPNLGTTATNGASSVYNAGAAPTTTFANLLQLLGSGGGTATGNGTVSANSTGSGTGSSTGSSTSTSVGGNAGSILSMFGL